MGVSTAVLQLKPGDEVAVALRDVAAGESLAPFPGVAAQAIPFGHKVALVPLEDGQVIRRLGQPIGVARGAIAAGAHVHLHNMGFEASMAGHAIGTRLSNAPLRAAGEIPTFEGDRNADGKVGTRNYVGVLSSVNCSSLVTRNQ